jgi:hypothetical protein
MYARKGNIHLMKSPENPEHRQPENVAIAAAAVETVVDNFLDTYL